MDVSKSRTQTGSLAWWQSLKVFKIAKHKCKGASGAAPSVGDGSVDQVPCREHDAQSKAGNREEMEECNASV